MTAIELGSSKAVMAAFKTSINSNCSDGVEIVSNHQGSKETPVCIAWIKNKPRAIGKSAII